jgi:hypothetical protein
VLPKWDERPLLVVRKSGAEVTCEEMIKQFKGHRLPRV